MKQTPETLICIYNLTIKPLMAELEGRAEQFAEPLLYELSGFYDCVAQYYDPENSPELSRQYIDPQTGRIF